MNRSNLASVAYHAFDELVWIAGLNAMWLLFTLLGGVVFGFAPATVAASSLVRKRFSGEKVRLVSEFWALYRREFLRANAFLLPSVVALVAVFLSWQYFNHGSDAASLVISGVAVVVLAIATGVVSLAVPLYCNYDVPVRSVLPNALNFALANPLALVLNLAALAAVAAVTWLLPGILPFFSAGTAVWLTTRLSLDFFARNEKRLEAAPSHDPARVGARVH